MTSTIPLPSDTAEVLKQDTRGRVRTPPERREALLEEFAHSGLSAAKFAKLVGVNYATFANWVQKRKRGRQTSDGAASAGGMAAVPSRNGPVRLFEAFAEIAGGESGCGLRVDLPGGARIQIQSPLQLQLVAELLRLLGQGGTRSC